MSDIPVIRFLDRTTPPHLFTLVVLSGLSALVMNIFLPSLPSMTAYFDTEYRIIQLSVAVYLLVNAILQLFIGPLSDKLGRRPVILWGIGLFLVATLGCLITDNIWIFLAFRMAQATIVVAMVLSRAMVRDMVPEDQAASMIGYVSMGMAIVPMVGPAIGGILEEAFSWHANFWLMFGLGSALFLLAWHDIGETSTPSGLTMTQQFKEYPELLTSPRFWGYAMASGLASGSFFSYLGGAPFVGSQVFGLDASELGLYFGVPAIGYFFGNFFSGKYSARFGVNKMVLWGSLLLVFGMTLMLILFLLGYGSVYVFFGLMTFVGLGNGLVIPNATSGLLSVRPHLAGTASGLGGSIMIGGGAALSALAGALLGPGTGAEPLIVLMLATSICGVIAIRLVIRREKHLKTLDLA